MSDKTRIEWTDATRGPASAAARIGHEHVEAVCSAYHHSREDERRAA